MCFAHSNTFFKTGSCLQPWLVWSLLYVIRRPDWPLVCSLLTLSPECWDYRWSYYCLAQMLPLSLGIIPKLKKLLCLFFVLVEIYIVFLTYDLRFTRMGCKNCFGVLITYLLFYFLEVGFLFVIVQVVLELSEICLPLPAK